MRRTLLLLLASLASLASLIVLADQSDLKVLSAPNLLRVGTAENIFVECQDCSGGNINVNIFVKNHPTKAKILASKTVTLTSAEHFQGFGEITIPAADFSKDPNKKQYVYLQAEFPGRVLEKTVLLSFQSGYIFIQTDKTLYTPNSKVYYRIFALTPGMKPVERDAQAIADTSVSIEIVTPQDIILPLDLVSLNSGIYSGHYQLSDIVSPGLWKLVAKFHSNPQESFSAEFEVKEYVLPSFEVKLIPMSSFYYVDSEELKINIEVAYLFGKEVEGTAYVVFGIMDKDVKRGLPHSLTRVPVQNGKGTVTLKRDQIIRTHPDINQLVGKSIYVSVSVLTESGSEMVQAELRGIQIVTSPYSISFKRTPKYFKPGMSFDVAVEVLNPDESPAEGIPVVVEPGSVRGFTAANGMARLTINTAALLTRLQITAKTEDSRILVNRQANATMEAVPYTTVSNSYIHIGVDTAELKLGDNLKIYLNLNKQPNKPKDIAYLISSRGQLVKFGRYKTHGQVLISLIVPITKEMLPSFRIIAYYHPTSDEVVSDSVWVDVKDTCMGTLTLEPTRGDAFYEPRGMFGLRVKGNPLSSVGLVAVDKGVYVLNNKHRLTQKKVWDIVERYDTGCTPGGGNNSMSVFKDAGLIFETSTALGTPYRQELKCEQPPPRSKRGTTIMDVRTTLVSNYTDELERECCLDGMKDIPVSYTCEQRSEYIVDGKKCAEAFLHCCKEMETQISEKKDENLQLARSESDDSYMDSNEINSRTQFPESWLWSDVTLPPCDRKDPNCEITSWEKNFPLQDSITTWQFTGISLSRTHGICVSKPLEVIVRKDFFIDLRLPYSAVRGEQLEIKAVLHNYNLETITVRVDLTEEEDVCSAASKRGRYRQVVKVGSKSTRALSLIVIPMKEGLRRIEVKGAVKDSSLTDGVMKMLKVVPEGVLDKTVQIVTLNPTSKGNNGEQVEILNSKIPKKDMLPNAPFTTQVSVTGREQVSGLVENAISGKSMGTLILQPGGCGEQNMIGMTLPVIATTYLDKTNQWEAVGFHKRNEAIQHIKTGYNNELAYRKPDGSFAVWAGGASSTWLTAYVVKVFSIAHTLIAVQQAHICDGVKFLILNAQQPDGLFKEVGNVIHSEMTGDVGGRDGDASMTAFCLIAMQESRTICAASINSLPGSIDKAVGYLEKRLPFLTNPYAVAMTSYALANEEKLNREILYKFTTDSAHWPVPEKHMFTQEATAYALLALVKSKAFEDAQPVVRWFSQQLFVGGGYGSTQATIIVYQAVSEYWSNAKEPEYDLNVDILLPGRSKPDQYNFNRDNHYATRTSKINEINQDVKVRATGSGEATVKMVSLYYTLPSEKESDCKKFNVSVQLDAEKLDEDEKVYMLTVEVLFKEERDATMSIIDIGLLTGFTVDTRDLKALSEGPARIIAKYEMNTVLSERGSLIIYLDKVSHTRPELISFRIHQTMKVGVLQPAAVSVYDYYDRTPCVKFYHPERRSGQLLQLCRDDECTCAEENCSMQKKEEVSNDDRTDIICETSKIEFAYKVVVEETEWDLSTDSYTMRLLDVIKEGSIDVGPLGKLRTFLSYQHCRAALGLTKGKTYLIMGSSKDIHIDEQKETYQYVLGERTWIEYWPTAAECQQDEHEPTCSGLEEMEDQYKNFACQQ